MSDRGTFVAGLSHNALLEVTGDDAAAFLHGQLTNDVQALAAGTAQWNGWCSPKGRLLATFLLLRRAEGYLLMLPSEIAEPIAKRLRMFVLRSKVKVDDVTARWERLGVAGPEAGALVARHFGTAPPPMRMAVKEAAVCAALDAERFVVLAPSEAASSVRNAFAAATPADTAAWDLAMIRAGIPWILARTQDQFVPQMANFELMGGVSFRKGCYPGQEIVARTQYRGILKRRMVRARVASGAPQPGDALRSASFGEQSAGMVVNSAPAPEGGHEVLAVAQLEAISARDLATADGAALEILELPYALAEAG